jgi:hypothetical protein
MGNDSEYQCPADSVSDEMGKGIRETGLSASSIEQEFF